MVSCTAQPSEDAAIGPAPTSITARKVTHNPGYAPASPSGLTVRGLEAVLSDWFGSEVVLTSSGRSALLLCLSTLGLSRYKHRVSVPRMISGCVLDAVIRRAFPIDTTAWDPVDVTILYHQYGIPQKFRPKTETIEDICHAFFSSEDTGARCWAGRLAIFSLPKFFQTASMIGGVISHDRDITERIRDIRSEVSSQSVALRARQAEVLQTNTAGPDLEQVYLSRLLNSRVEDDEIGGAPSSREDIKRIAQLRCENLDRLLVASGARPAQWARMLRATLPFAFPVFGDPQELEQASRILQQSGIIAGFYQIDFARNAERPDHRTALLLPCHHLVGEDKIELMCEVLSATLEHDR